MTVKRIRSMYPNCVAILTVAAVSAWTVGAAAQTVPTTAGAASTGVAPSTPPATPPPDVVETQDGGFLRGTIIEQVPGRSVVIMLVTGETRTIDMANVRYAGRDRSAAPRPPADVASTPPPLRNPQEFTVSVTAQGRTDLSLHQVRGNSSMTLVGAFGMSTPMDSFEPVCRIPCRFSVTRGTYMFGVSEGAGSVARAGDEPLSIGASGNLQVAYETRQGVRTAGIVLLISGIATVAVTAVATFAMFSSYSYGSGIALPVMLVGIGVGGIAVSIAPFLMGVRDHASAQFDR